MYRFYLILQVCVDIYDICPLQIRIFPTSNDFQISKAARNPSKCLKKILIFKSGLEIYYPKISGIHVSPLLHRRITSNILFLVHLRVSSARFKTGHDFRYSDAIFPCESAFLVRGHRCRRRRERVHR